MVGTWGRHSERWETIEAGEKTFGRILTSKTLRDEAQRGGVGRGERRKERNDEETERLHDEDFCAGIDSKAEEVQRVVDAPVVPPELGRMELDFARV